MVLKRRNLMANLCKKCKKETYSTINNKCVNCYYDWEGLESIDKFIIIAMINIIIIEFFILIAALL
jgi:hypothetical protein